MSGSFSFARMWAILLKEFIQMRRDRFTFGIMVMVPVMQLILFGFAINSDPKQLPAAVLSADYGPQARTVLSAVQQSAYFSFVRQVSSESEGHDLLARGEWCAAFALNEKSSLQ